MCKFYRQSKLCRSEARGGEGELKCPECNGKLKVDGSLADERMVVRKRKCLECGHILFTVEAQTDGASDVYRKMANQKSLKEYYDRKERKRGAE